MLARCRVFFLKALDVVCVANQRTNAYRVFRFRSNLPPRRAITFSQCVPVNRSTLYCVYHRRTVKNELICMNVRSTWRAATTFSKLGVQFLGLQVIVQNKIRMVYPFSWTACSLLRNGNHSSSKKLGWSVQILGVRTPRTPSGCALVYMRNSADRSRQRSTLKSDSNSAAVLQNEVLDDYCAV